MARISVLAAFMALVNINSLGAEINPAAPRGPDAKGTDPTIVGEEVAIVTQAPAVPPPHQAFTRHQDDRYA